jgi:hypothetical protein
MNKSFAGESQRYSKMRITDGTSERELIKAMGTFLNRTGAADYNLPSMIGERLMDASKKNFPSWNL